VGLVIGTKS